MVLPYDSTQQVTSGVLVEAIAKGRPVVATAFPHAVELLSSGAGIVVNHQDQDALAAARRHADPAGSGRRHGRRSPPAGAEYGLAGGRQAYLVLAQRLCASGTAVSEAPGPGFRSSVADDGRSRHLRTCLGAEPRPEHGYCTDDMARVLVVTTREPDASGDVNRLAVSLCGS